MDRDVMDRDDARHMLGDPTGQKAPALAELFARGGD